MKKFIKSWRWKRLFSKSASKQINFVEIFLKISVIIALIYMLKFSSLFEISPQTPLWEVIFLNTFCGLTLLAGILLIFEDLQETCMAKDAYEVKFNNQNALCFIYRLSATKEKALFELIVVDGKKEVYQNFVTDYFITNDGKISKNIIFKENQTQSWYIINNQGVHELGTKIQKNVFLKPQPGKPITNAELCILTPNGYQIVCADYFVNHNNLYIPYLALEKAVPKEESLFVNSKLKNALPDEYLLIKHNGEYRFLGIYFKNDAKNEPFFQELIVENAIFREGLDAIILSSVLLDEKQEYFILHQKTSTSIHFKTNVIIEMTDSEKIEGKILVFYNQQMQSIYEGKFRSIDFVNHKVIGQDNKIYL